MSVLCVSFSGAHAGVIPSEDFLNGTMGASYVATDGMWYVLPCTSCICLGTMAILLCTMLLGAFVPDSMLTDYKYVVVTTQAL